MGIRRISTQSIYHDLSRRKVNSRCHFRMVELLLISTLWTCLLRMKRVHNAHGKKQKLADYQECAVTIATFNSTLLLGGLERSQMIVVCLFSPLRLKIAASWPQRMTQRTFVGKMIVIRLWASYVMFRSAQHYIWPLSHINAMAEEKQHTRNAIAYVIVWSIV